MKAKNTDGDESGGEQCPTCGKECKNEHGVAIHHYRSHGEKIGQVETECDGCGANITKKRHQVEQSENVFCDDECYRSSMGNKERFECDYCGGINHRPPSKVNHSGNNFCDFECKGMWRRDRVEFECDYCGECEVRKRSNVDLQGNNFCSRACYYLYDVGENSGTWKGGRDDYYGPSWRKKRRLALGRDGYECQYCGTTQEEHNEMFGRSLDVHHITPFRKFGVENHKEANDLANLITLCRPCHERLEGVPIQWDG